MDPVCPDISCGNVRNISFRQWLWALFCSLPPDARRSVCRKRIFGSSRTAERWIKKRERLLPLSASVDASLAGFWRLYAEGEPPRSLFVAIFDNLIQWHYVAVSMRNILLNSSSAWLFTALFFYFPSWTFLSTCKAASTTNTPYAATLGYSSFFGGKGVDYWEHNGFDIAVDKAGFVYIVGFFSSTRFPAVTYRFGDTNANWGSLVAKFNPTNHSVVFSSFLAYGRARSVALDAIGNIYLTGDSSELFPTTANAYSSVTHHDGRDGFVAKLSPDGSQLLFSTILGGDSVDMARKLALDSKGNIWVTGWTSSTNFPVTTKAVQSALAGGYDIFAAELSGDGTQLLYSTYLGGEFSDFGACLAVDGNDNLFLTGWTQSDSWNVKSAVNRIGVGSGKNAFVAKMKATSLSLEYLTLMGGSESQSAGALALDKTGNIYVWGMTESTDFPVTAGCWQSANRGEADNFLIKLSADGQRAIYSTYLGGMWRENLNYDEFWEGDNLISLEATGMAVDDDGNAYVAGATSSADIALPGAAASSLSDYYDGYVAKINPDGSQLLYCYYLGGSEYDGIYGLALGSNGSVYVTGQSASSIRPRFFPTTPDAVQPAFGGGNSDAFLAQIIQAPLAAFNDAFANRLLLHGSRVTAQGVNGSATRESGEPMHANQTGGKSLWWSWQAPANGRLLLTTVGSDFDTLLAVYSGTNLAQLSPIASNDNESPDRNTSAIEFKVSSGAVYQIAVDGKEGAAGFISLCLTFSRPVNDDFSDRTQLSNKLPVTANGSNLDATMEPSEYGMEYKWSRSVWWEWTSPITGDIAINTLGSDFDTVLSVYTNSTLADLQLVAASDDYTNGLFTSQATFQAKAGVVYQIAVDGKRGAFGNIQLSIQSGAPPANDNFASRTVIAGTFTNISGYNINATTEAGEKNLSYQYPAYETVWWSWTAPMDGRVAMATEGSSFDTRLGVFKGNSVSNLVLLTENDNVQYLDRRESGSRVDLAVKAGEVYQIMVDGTGTDSHGAIQLGLRFYHPFGIVLNSAKRLTDGTVQFQVQGWSGNTYAIQTTTNLIQWNTISSNAFTGESFVFEDPDAKQLNRRIYRVIELP